MSDIEKMMGFRHEVALPMTCVVVAILDNKISRAQAKSAFMMVLKDCDEVMADACIEKVKETSALVALAFQDVGN